MHIKYLLLHAKSSLYSVIPMSVFQAIDELLTFNCDPSLPLTHGVGSALCAATSTEYEYRRTNINQRLHLVSTCTFRIL